MVRTVRKQYKRQKRKQAVQRAFLMVCLMAFIVIALRTATDHLPAGMLKRQTTAANLKSPVARQNAQISRDLKQYAATHKNAAKIYENRDMYPESLLAAYLNNPEMEGFVTGYPGTDVSESGVLTAKEAEEDIPLLLQWDKRWGYASYGGSIIGLSGCGPTCLSMVYVALTGDVDKTPFFIARLSEKNDYYVEGSGTSWALMTSGATQLGLSFRELPLAESVMKSALDAGEPIICSMGAGDFTTQGHFIVIRGYNEHGFLVNDPNCIARSGQAWQFETLQGQIKNLWAYAY